MRTCVSSVPPPFARSGDLRRPRADGAQKERRVGVLLLLLLLLLRDLLERLQHLQPGLQLRLVQHHGGHHGVASLLARGKVDLGHVVRVVGADDVDSGRTLLTH